MFLGFCFLQHEGDSSLTERICFPRELRLTRCHHTIYPSFNILRKLTHARLLFLLRRKGASGHRGKTNLGIALIAKLKVALDLYSTESDAFNIYRNACLSVRSQTEPTNGLPTALVVCSSVRLYY